MKFILGKKLGMTQVFKEDGTVLPVTRVQAGPCVVTQVKTKKNSGVDAVQVGFGEQKAFRKNKPEQGHLKGLDSVAVMREFQADNHGLKRGDAFSVAIFEPGEKVQVTGKSKGKGFQGVVKRHGFAGSPASHGHKDQLRMPGSIGATDAARVFKGTRMGGHMGDARVTVKNLEIVEVSTENNELLIKGALPGARGGLLMISTPEGKIEITQPEPAAEETPEAAPEEETAQAPEESTEEPKAEEAKEEAPAKEEPKAEAPTEEAPAESNTEEKSEEEAKA